MRVFAYIKNIDKVTLTRELTPGGGIMFQSSSVQGDGMLSRNLFSRKLPSAVLLAAGLMSASWATNYSAWLANEPLVITPGTGVAAAVTNFPVLVNLTSSNSAVFAYSRADGFDVRFTNAAGTTDLPFQRQSFNKTAKTAEFWVLVPSVAANPATTTIKMYWGNAAATDVQAPTSVFSTANGYKAVWHMSAAAGSNEPDVTGGGYDLVPTASPTITSGAVGAGVAKSFDGSSQYFTAKNSGVGSALAFPAGGPLTISAWINDASSQSGQQILGKINTGTVGTWDGSYGWIYRGGATGTLGFNDEDGANGFERCDYNVSAGQWTHIVWIRNGTGNDLANTNVYANGVVAGAQQGTNNTTATVQDDSLLFTIGADSPDSALSIGITEYWAGSVQEVQVLGKVLDSSTIALMYQNQKTPSNLISFGTVGVQPGAAILPASSFGLVQKGMNVEYTLPRSASMQISLIDIRGRTVLDLKRAEAAGSHVLQLTRTNLTAGTYIVCLKSSGLEKRITVNITR